MYHGDIALGSTIDIKFTTRRFSTGAPYTLAGTPVISAYPDNSTTQLTAGITLTADFDTVTGLNNVRVVATSGNGYATATNYTLVITTGTVDSVSVVGECVGSFSIENRSALRPTTSGRTLDVSSTGEAGLDWANIGSPTTTVGLSGTTVKTATDVETDTADIQSRLPAALVSGRMSSDMAAISGDSAAADNLETMLDGTGGNVLTLSQLRINSTAAAGAIDIDNSAGPGIDSRGTIGLYAQGSGASNYGIEAVGTGATDSGGIKASATTAGEGIEGVAAGNGHGLLVVGAGSGEGLHATAGGGANAHGAHFEGVGANSSGALFSRGGAGGDDMAFANNDVTIANVTTVNGLAAGVITATAVATGAIDADAIADNAIDAGAIATGAITNAKFAAGAIDAAAIADSAIDANTFAAGAITAAAIATGAIDADALASDAANEIADALLARNIAGGSSTGRIVTDALRALRNRVVVDGTTITVYQEDDTATAWSGAATRDAGLDTLKEINPT